MGVRQVVYTHTDRRSYIKTMDNITFIVPYNGYRNEETGEEINTK